MSAKPEKIEAASESVRAMGMGFVSLGMELAMQTSRQMWAASAATFVLGSSGTTAQWLEHQAVLARAYSALGNLLQNAFKFTHHQIEVTLDEYALSDRILIDVKDHCGGLPPGNAERMFLPFTQNDKERTALGLGLSIARRIVEANDGVLSVRDVPGTGCVFTISLPRYAVRSSPA